MRCLSCNCVLSDFEATRKSERTGEFLDLCNHCLDTIREDIIVLEREDLRSEKESYEDEVEITLESDTA